MVELNIEVGNFNLYSNELFDQGVEEESADIAKEVKKVWLLQQQRYEGYNIKTNNRLDGQLLIDYAMPVDAGKELLNEAATKFRLSMRAYNRILRVARTIADLEESSKVFKIHIAEALNYRNFNL